MIWELDDFDIKILRQLCKLHIVYKFYFLKQKKIKEDFYICVKSELKQGPMHTDYCIRTSWRTVPIENQCITSF